MKSAIENVVPSIGVDRVLVEPGAGHEQRILGRLGDELGRDEGVVDERVAASHELEPARSDQAGIAGAGAYEEDGHGSASLTSASKKSRRSSYVGNRSFTVGRIASSRWASSA